MKSLNEDLFILLSNLTGAVLLQSELNDVIYCVHKYCHPSEKSIEVISRLLWEKDCPNGGSVVKVWEENQFHDRELYRKEALALLNAQEV